MKIRTKLLFCAIALVLAGCGADDVIDNAAESAENAANDAIAAQLSSLIVGNSDLAAADADCVAGAVVDDLGASTVVSLAIETNGDFSKLSEADRNRLAGAVQAAGSTCAVDASDFMA